MKTKIIQLFQTKAEAFEWIMEVVQDASIGEITTDSTFCVTCETEQNLYIGVFQS